MNFFSEIFYFYYDSEIPDLQDLAIKFVLYGGRKKIFFIKIKFWIKELEISMVFCGIYLYHFYEICGVWRDFFLKKVWNLCL